ncbi:MAG: iron-sulfur cluster assembly protein [Pseudomonadota bacterium]|nr:iron-sulfur cluster assembly protein [Pseudomonadota bacterium]
MLNEPEKLKEKILAALGSVRDPSTGMQVIDLPLLDKLEIDEKGIIITLTPSSNICPLIFKLGNDMKLAAQKAAPDLPIRFIINNHRQKDEVEECLSDN